MAKKPGAPDGSVPNRDQAGIGMLGEGLNVVEKDSPPFKLFFKQKTAYEIDPDAIEPDAPEEE